LDPAAGTVVATRYRILRPLGRGGMGEVWAAENTRTGRQVAIKLLRAESKSKASAVERFRREARAAGSINSDHVTQVLDVDEDPEHGIAIVFELLEGESLIERLKRTGPMSFEELHPVIEQVWMGLVDAHRAGIIHRDLKPSNVFLEARPDGTTRVKILDFGISKLPKEISGETLTEMGQSLGTFSFMPPEQIGKAKTVDHRADIYACATLIYQALSGQLPYDARNILVMVELKSKQEPRALSAVMDEPVDPALEAFLAKGLARDPNHRFQSAFEALTAWRELGPTVVSSRPASWGGASGPPTPMDASKAAAAQQQMLAAQQAAAQQAAAQQAAAQQAAAQQAAAQQAQRQGAVPSPAPARLLVTAPLVPRPTGPDAPTASERPIELAADSGPRDSTTAPSRHIPVMSDPTISDGIATIAMPMGMVVGRGSQEPPTVPRPGVPLAALTPSPSSSQRAGNGTLVMEYDPRTGQAIPYTKSPQRPKIPSAPGYGPLPVPPSPSPSFDEQERARQQQAASYGASPAQPPTPIGGTELAPTPARGRGVAPLILGAIVFALVGFGLVAVLLRVLNL
jgi:serine/threonine-protein kinase